MTMVPASPRGFFFRSLESSLSYASGSSSGHQAEKHQMLWGGSWGWGSPLPSPGPLHAHTPSSPRGSRGAGRELSCFPLSQTWTHLPPGSP